MEIHLSISEEQINYYLQFYPILWALGTLILWRPVSNLVYKIMGEPVPPSILAGLCIALIWVIWIPVLLVYCVFRYTLFLGFPKGKR